MNTKKIIEPTSKSKMLFASLKKCKSLAEEGAVFIKLHELGYPYDHISEAIGVDILTVKSRVKIAMLEPEIQPYFCAGGLSYTYTVVNAISNMDSGSRVKIVTDLFNKKADSRQILKALNVKMPKSRDPFARNEPKVLDMNLIDECAQKVCSRCALNDTKTKYMCKECPATELINWINKSMEVK